MTQSHNQTSEEQFGKVLTSSIKCLKIATLFFILPMWIIVPSWTKFIIPINLIALAWYINI